VKSTLLFENDKLDISDATPSPDGTTLAFLGKSETDTALYTVPIAGGTPKKLTTFDHQAVILDYRP
jgi:Tol biopolymer transport system component